MLLNQAMFAFAATCALMLGDCFGTPENPIINTTSGCPEGGNAAFSSLGLEGHSRQPFCPVKLKCPNGGCVEPWVDFRLDVWDLQYRMGPNDRIRTRINNKAGAWVWDLQDAFFRLNNLGQPGNMYAAMVVGPYPPGISGYVAGATNNMDRAIVSYVPASGTSSAEGFVNLTYIPETGVTLTGATSFPWGTAPSYTGNATRVRRPATITWKLDNVVVRTATIGWPTEYDYYAPVVTTTGSHTLRVDVTSGTNTLSSATKVFTVIAPPECGGPALPIRAGEPESAGANAVPIAPGTPPHTSCPPQ